MYELLNRIRNSRNLHCSRAGVYSWPVTPDPRARAGLGPQIWQLRCGPGRAWTYFLRAGPGPGLIFQFAGRAQAWSAPLLWARASNHIYRFDWAYISRQCRALMATTHRVDNMIWWYTKKEVGISIASPAAQHTPTTTVIHYQVLPRLWRIEIGHHKNNYHHGTTSI